MEAYYVKCRAKREMKDPKTITMKNGKLATQGDILSYQCHSGIHIVIFRKGGYQ